MDPIIFDADGISLLSSDVAKVFTTYQTFLYFCRNLNMFIKKKLKYFTRPKQISPDLSDVFGDFRIVCVIVKYHSHVQQQMEMFASLGWSWSRLSV